MARVLPKALVQRIIKAIIAFLVATLSQKK